MKILKNIIISITLSSSLSYALTLAQLQGMPKSVERDFYIWEYLKQSNTSKADAIKAIKLVNRVNKKLSIAYNLKTGLHIRKWVKPASYAGNSKKYGMLINRMKKSGDFYAQWLKLSRHDKLKVFALAGLYNRKELDKRFNQSLYNSLQKDKLINQVIFRAFRENLYNIQNSILSYPPIGGTKISYDNLFKLGFKSLKLGNRNSAFNFFNAARYNAISRFYADRAIFWAYMATKSTKLLNRLANSHDFNIYKLIALDMLNKPYPLPHKESLNKNASSNIDITNPISWALLKQKIFSGRYNLYKLARRYNSVASQAYYYYILNKASKDTKQYFPMPYREYISKYPVDRQALIYAIAKQESQFIPSAISSSFAVGMMQFMPFLVKHIAKVRGESVTLEDMFKPEVAIRFANTHLNYLNKYLYHPLFVAYAYNAGIGYTRRLIRKNIFKSGAYEPYLSIEMVDNKQANHYGKKVLANYVIYKKLLGSPIKISSLLYLLDKPMLTDRFR